MIRDWTDSLRMDGLSAEAERLFTRLIMRADDYGRFHGESRLVKANCFPLSEDIKAAEIGPWLCELADRGLIVMYEADGRKILAIANYGQRLKKSRVKFPPLPGMEQDWLPMFDSFLPIPGTSPLNDAEFREVPGSSGKFPPEEKGREAEVEVETEKKPKREAETSGGAAQRNAAATFLNETELAHLAFSGKLITLELGIRFLTDYLDGDTYFKTKRPGHNLDRCRNQFALVSALEENMDAMEEIVRRSADLPSA